MLPTVVRNPSPDRSAACDRCAGGGEHALRVVAASGRARPLWSAIGDEPSKQHARLDLAAGDRQLVVDAGERRAVDGERREAALACLDPRAHLRQRLGDPVDRPAADRVIAVELEARPCWRPASPAAAASACRRCRRRSARRAPSPSRSPHPRITSSPSAARRSRRAADRGKRRVGVGRVEVVADAYWLGRHRADDRGAVGDRLVRGRRYAAPQAVRMARSACSCARHRESKLADELLGARAPPARRRSTARPRPRSCPAAGYSAMSVMLTPARPSSSASCATTPGRFGTDDAQLEQRAARELRLEQPAAVVARPRRSRRRCASRRRRRAPREPRLAARSRRRSAPRSRRGSRGRCRSRSRSARRRRGWRRESSGRSRAAAWVGGVGGDQIQASGRPGRRARWRAHAADARPSPEACHASRRRSRSGGRPSPCRRR